MNSIRTSHEDRTELRLDYRDLVAGQLLIVIDGLPPAGHGGGLRRAAPSGPIGGRSRRTPSAPLIAEAEAIDEATGYGPALLTPLLRAAWRGQEALVLELGAATIEEAGAGDAARATALTEYAKAVLYNGLGHYEQAVAAAGRACAGNDPGSLDRARVELVEACARSDDLAAATGALRDLDERARSKGTDWTLGVRARSAALLGDGDAAESLYREAIDRFGRCRTVVHLARAQLVYGEWLRRQNRRVDAREQLRAAHDTFGRVEAAGFAERARRELLATGETARRRTDEARAQLTPQEAQIAQLARDGLSNPEIGAQLFISPRTVQYHLRKVFLKLDITSRYQLARIAPGRLGLA